MAVLTKVNGVLRRITLESIKCKKSKVNDLTVGAATAPYFKNIEYLN